MNEQKINPKLNPKNPQYQWATRKDPKEAEELQKIRYEYDKIHPRKPVIRILPPFRHLCEISNLQKLQTDYSKFQPKLTEFQKAYIESEIANLEKQLEKALNILNAFIEKQSQKIEKQMTIPVLGRDFEQDLAAIEEYNAKHYGPAFQEVEFAKWRIERLKYEHSTHPETREFFKQKEECMLHVRIEELF
ncbi:MAG: hypothetical protein G01um101418_542 [Parcubacteria group bacterium Gr01-1014_18]|nr:MAG: hypothetical protein Greene041636_588 [Parcubacteria group bacterium Greene0416_36]TSC81005.1 MAG: hypothetical protein G01um101418_542 [Parcubacteria group bacterium Gr01-1014_18]TSC98892.1 MAG: hypothetical protein Greene101420_525 [Parcubacteria group bacterium Greene1014_20]TSD06522.1 MAG: hypothetical protein Greene07142_797 [Parcubacteria group bacterium Greene0714_2]